MKKFMIVQKPTPKDHVFDIFDDEAEARETYARLSELVSKRPDYFLLGLVSFEAIDATGIARSLLRE